MYPYVNRRQQRMYPYVNRRQQRMYPNGWPSCERIQRRSSCAYGGHSLLSMVEPGTRFAMISGCKSALFGQERTRSELSCSALSWKSKDGLRCALLPGYTSSSSPLALVVFHNFCCATQRDGVLKHVIRADVATEIEPIYESRLWDPARKHGLNGDCRNIPHEEKDDWHDDSQTQLAFGEEACLPNTGLLSAVAATKHRAVCPHRHPDLATPNSTRVAVFRFPQRALVPHQADGGNVVTQMAEKLKGVHLLPWMELKCRTSCQKGRLTSLLPLYDVNTMKSCILTPKDRCSDREEISKGVRARSRTLHIKLWQKWRRFDISLFVQHHSSIIKAHALLHRPAAQDSWALKVRNILDNISLYFLYMVPVPLT